MSLSAILERIQMLSAEIEKIAGHHNTLVGRLMEAKELYDILFANSGEQKSIAPIEAENIPE